jgi:polar amino acid transport system substrate-binding protein
MRRWLIAVLTLLLLTAAACGEGDTEVDDNGTDTGDQEETVEFTTIEEGVLTVGSCLDYAPFEFFEEGAEEPTGFDVEIVDAIASELDLEVKWTKANFDTIFTALQGGQFDMVAAASTITPEREEIVAFSDPYFNARQGLSVQSGGEITGQGDLGEGHTVGVQKGTTGEAWAKENLVPNGAELKSFESAPDAFADLEAGNVDAVVNDEGSSIEEVDARSGLEVIEAIDTDENYGLALPQDNAELKEAVDQALATIIENGTYEEIFSKYFPDLEVPDEFAGME